MYSKDIWNFFYQRQKKHEIYFNDVLQVNNKKFWLLFNKKILLRLLHRGGDEL